MLRHSFFNVVVANSFSCAQTKTILGGTFAPYFLASLVAGMRSGFFSLATAGLNDPHTEPIGSRHSSCGWQGSNDWVFVELPDGDRGSAAVSSRLKTCI